MSAATGKAQILHQHGALAMGADLWVIPSKEDTDWISQMDWYLNFQISRAAHHKPKEFSPEMKDILQENELETQAKDSQGKPYLMIACENRLPAKMLVRVPTNENFEEWIGQVCEVWKQLLKPSIRLFLPHGFPISQFSNYWAEGESIDEITLVPSQRTTNQ